MQTEVALQFMRSVYSGPGVKNAVCGDKRWRLEKPEMDFG